MNENVSLIRRGVSLIATSNTEKKKPFKLREKLVVQIQLQLQRVHTLQSVQ